MASNDKDISIVELSSSTDESLLLESKKDEMSQGFSSSGDEALLAYDPIMISTPIKKENETENPLANLSPICIKQEPSDLSASMFVNTSGSLTESQLEPLNFTEFSQYEDSQYEDMEDSSVDESASALKVRMDYLLDQRKKLNEVMTSAACRLTDIEREIEEIKTGQSHK